MFQNVLAQPRFTDLQDDNHSKYLQPPMNTFPAYAGAFMPLGVCFIARLCPWLCLYTLYLLALLLVIQVSVVMSLVVRVTFVEHLSFLCLLVTATGWRVLHELLPVLLWLWCGHWKMGWKVRWREPVRQQGTVLDASHDDAGIPRHPPCSGRWPRHCCGCWGHHGQNVGHLERRLL